MGFPPHHRFPLQEPRSPGVPPVAGASLMILCQTLAAILTLFPVCSLWPLWLPGITSICLIPVELWDEGDTRVEELIALTADYNVARAAYEEAMKRRPGRIVTLRQKTRVVADSRRQT